MGIFTLTDATIWAHDQDVTGRSNKLTLKATLDDRESTVFGGGGTKRRIGGLRDVELDGEGFCDDTAGPDAAAFAALGVTNRAVTVAPTSTAGSTAYFFQAGQFSYETFDEVGAVCPFTINLKGSGRLGLIRGQVAKAKGVVSSTGALGSGLNLGAGGAGKWLYAALHAFAAGTTVTVIVQSDTTSGFSAPTTRATIGPLTTAGATFLPRVDVSGVTDTWWRFNVSAVTGSFTLAGALAIQ